MTEAVPPSESAERDAEPTPRITGREITIVVPTTRTSNLMMAQTSIRMAELAASPLVKVGESLALIHKQHQERLASALTANAMDGMIRSFDVASRSLLPIPPGFFAPMTTKLLAPMSGRFFPAITDIALSAIAARNRAVMPVLSMGIARQLPGLFPAMDMLRAYSDLFCKQMAPITDALRRILGQWQGAARFGAGVVRRIGQWAYLYALQTREAILSSKDDEPVREFLQVVLGRPRVTPELVEAAKTVLLEDAWIGVAAESPHQLVTHFKASVRREHGRWKPLWERNLHYGGIRMLGEETVAGTLEDLISDHRDPEELMLAGDISDPLARYVMGNLKPEQQQVLTAYADHGLTWDQAAAECGYPAELGEKTRRRREYLRKEYQRRQAVRSHGAQR